MIQTIRGKNYNMRKIMELYDSGLTPAEIAHRLRINSDQSLRHAIERQNREREEKERILSKQLTRKMKPSRKWNKKGWNTRQDRRIKPRRKS